MWSGGGGRAALLQVGRSLWKLSLPSASVDAIVQLGIDPLVEMRIVKQERERESAARNEGCNFRDVERS